MKVPLHIRMLTAEDAPALVEHLVRNFPSPGVGAPPISDPFPRNTKIDVTARIESTKKGLALPPGTVGWKRAWGAFVELPNSGDKIIVGELTLSTSRLIETQMHRAVLGMGLELQHRGSGLGTELLGTALKWARGQKFLSWIDLGVFAHNAAARRLYEKFGFIETGRCIDCFRVDNLSVDDIQMTLNLKQ